MAEAQRTSGSDPEWLSVVQMREGFERVGATIRLSSLERKSAAATPQPQASRLQRWLVRYIYADQNGSPTVRRGLAPVLARLNGGTEWGLNLGAGDTSLHARMINLDVSDAPTIQLVSHGDDIPLRTASIACVVSQEVLEHVPDPWACVREVERVLMTGGLFYLQLPFIIGYHPGPTDYWRFTREGIKELLPADRWQIVDGDLVLGSASGFYRIAVEFTAVLFSAICQRLYKPCKALAAIVLWPIKLLDPLVQRSRERDRTAGGYWVLAKRLRADAAPSS